MNWQKEASLVNKSPQKLNQQRVKQFNNHYNLVNNLKHHLQQHKHRDLNVSVKKKFSK